MEPLGAAGYVMVAAAAVVAMFLGALAGTIAWAVKRGPLWGGVAAMGAYLASTVVFGSARLAPAALIGIPLLTLTLLTSWLTASQLEARMRLRRMWAALLGFACALLLGYPWGFCSDWGYGFRVQPRWRPTCVSSECFSTHGGPKTARRGTRRGGNAASTSRSRAALNRKPPRSTPCRSLRIALHFRTSCC
jgi:hypothetical protein